MKKRTGHQGMRTSDALPPISIAERITWAEYEWNRARCLAARHPDDRVLAVAAESRGSELRQLLAMQAAVARARPATRSNRRNKVPARMAS